MSSINNNTMKPQCIFASGAEALLAVKLFELRNAKKDPLDTIADIFCLLVIYGDDETLKDRMVAMNTMETIVEAIKRPSENIQFLQGAARVLVELIEDSTERSTSFLDCGGLDCCLEVMTEYDSNCSLVASYVCVLMTMLYVVTDHQRASIACSVLEKVVTAMERHSQDSSLYFVACATIGLCSGPGVLIPVELRTRAVQCIYDGILFLKHHEDSQAIGRLLLVHMLGPEAAMQMIDHAEMHHCQDATCSCAA